MTILEMKPDIAMVDVNSDGHIDVSDLTGIVRFILDDADESLIFDAADMDGNGVVEVNDYAALVKLILNQENNTVKARRGHAHLERLVGMIDSGNGELLITLLANSNFTGMQFDLQLPEGVTLIEDAIEVESGQHGCWSVQLQDGAYRILCSSMSNAELREGAVLRLRTEGNVDGVASIRNVVLSDTKATRHEAASSQIVVNRATDIANVGTEGLNISAKGGMLTLSASKDQTVRVVSLNGVVIENLHLSAGQQMTVNLPSGFYLVNKKKVFVQ